MAAKYYADAVEQGCRALAISFAILLAAMLIGAGIGIWRAFN